MGKNVAGEQLLKEEGCVGEGFKFVFRSNGRKRHKSRKADKNCSVQKSIRVMDEKKKKKKVWGRFFFFF